MKTPPDRGVDPVQRTCESHERFLRELVRGKYVPLARYILGGLRFGIARRWNSWYPSYFDVEGGCYVLIPGDVDLKHEGNKKDKRVGVVVIDPGFRFMDILRSEYQIEPRDISSVIVTHYHPDHMGGLLEFAAIMKTSKQPCTMYVNSTTFGSFRSLQDTFINVCELCDGQIQELLKYVARDGKLVQARIRAVRVHHNEIGNQHASLGLVLEISQSSSERQSNPGQSVYRIGIMGDTDGSAEYIPEYVREFSNVDVLLLHLGTYSDRKFGHGGKHLYVEGVKNVLSGFGTHLRESGKAGGSSLTNMVVVLSEFGLELAEPPQLYATLRPFIASHSWRLPLIYAQLRGNTTLDETTKNGSVAKFFAKGTLDTIGHVCSPFDQPSNMPSQNTGEAEELLLSIGFLVLSRTGSGLEPAIKRFVQKFSRTLDTTKSKRLEDGISYDSFKKMLRTYLVNEASYEEVRAFFARLIADADFGKTPFPIEHLLRCCRELLLLTHGNLEHADRLLYFADRLWYVSEYAESRALFPGISSAGCAEANTSEVYKWAYRKGAPTETAVRFWAVCAAGALALEDELERHTFENHPDSTGHMLLAARAMFEPLTRDWCNLLIGDIGCTFGLSPFSLPDNTARQDGLKLRSAAGNWISPYDAECFYDEAKGGFNYRTPEQSKA